MLGLQTIAYAQGGQSSPNAGGDIMGLILGMGPLILLFVFMYVIMIRPQKKKEKELRIKISKMKVGDKIVTIGGIVGKIAKIKDDTIVIETGSIGNPAEKSFIKFEKTAIKDIELKETN